MMQLRQANKSRTLLTIAYAIFGGRRHQLDKHESSEERFSFSYQLLLRLLLPARKEEQAA
jgi:hypothetical protein